MKTLTTTVPVANAVGSISKIGVVSWLDYSHLAAPYGQIICAAVAPSGKAYPGPGQFYVLQVSDSGLCVVLSVNPAPVLTTDQLITTQVQLTGTPYTTVAQLYDATVGTRAAKLLALEAQMVAWGLWSAGLAGS